MKDFYTDQVLGEWTLMDKSKDFLTYCRKANVKLHRQHAMTQIDTEDNCKYHLWGEVVLRQEKKIHIPSSRESIYRFLDKTDKTEKEKVIN